MTLRNAINIFNGFFKKTSFDATTMQATHSYNIGKFKFPLDRPELFYVLPQSIMKEILLSPEEQHQYIDPLRHKLDLFVKENGSWFDKKTISAVNAELDRLGVKLTKEAYLAIKNDILHTKHIDTRIDKIAGRYEQFNHQVEIAKAFANSGEMEGAILHTILAGGVKLLAGFNEAMAHTTYTERLKGLT